MPHPAPVSSHHFLPALAPLFARLQTSGTSALHQRGARPFFVLYNMAGDDKPRKGDPQRKDHVEVLERIETKKPRLYRVILYNDDYTTREFVVYILMHFFRKEPTEAEQLMLQAHRSGRALVGLYTKEIAETKVTQAIDLAREYNYPLLLSMEPED